MPDCRGGSQDGPLSGATSSGYGTAWPSARAGQRTQTVRLSAALRAGSRREGERFGINRIYRLYREEGLTVRKRKARRKAVGTRAPILVAARPNARWSLDFASRTSGSSTISSPAASASGCSTWSTMLPGSASPPSRTLSYSPIVGQDLA
ncbi:transposase [Thioclava atlantica]|uniref:Transposase n=1 Tax=Thioclava atlantica TaxID=1317124 RepID=A0A085TRE7_9RHOB|nr:transposase [Thioclava atlantica]